MESAGFDTDIALEPSGEGRWSGAITPSWDTPRGPLGGYVMAILMRGLELAVADPARSARSATVHFLRSPAAGRVEVSAVEERRGRSLSTVTGRLEQGGKLIAIGLGAYSTAWEGPLLDAPPMPEVEPADDDRDPAARDFPRKDPPPFTHRLTMQHRFGDAAFTGAAEGLTGGWLGLRERRPLDAPVIAMLADAWFPAPWPRLAALAPAPTVDLTVHFRTALPLPDSLLLGRFTSHLVREGFFDENGELWTPDGTLVAQSRQLGLLLDAAV